MDKRGKWVRVPDIPLPATDVNARPLAGIFINTEWRDALLSLVQHADQLAAWESDDADRIEQQAYALFRAIRRGSGMIGAIVPYITTEPPLGTLPCDGSIYERDEWPALYAALDNQYILDPNHFQTPDLRGRFVLGAIHPDYPLNSTGGAAAHTLTVDELASHDHETLDHAHTTEDHTHTTQAHAHTTEDHAHTTQDHTHVTDDHTHVTDDHAHTAQPHAHTTLPHNHTDAGHSHGEGNALPSVSGIGLDAPVPSAVPGLGSTAPAFANITPADVTVNAETVTIDAANVTIQASNVTVQPSNVTVDPANVTVNETTVIVDPANVTVNPANVTVLAAGGGQPHNNMPPYIALNYCIVAV